MLRLSRVVKALKRNYQNGFKFPELDTLTLFTCVIIGSAAGFLFGNKFLAKRNFINGNFNVIPKDFKQEHIKLGINIVKNSES